MTKKKTIELDGLIDGALWPDKDVILPHEGANPGKPKVRSSVQALKNKYRQQRLAKQKKALVKAKKSELAITNKKEMKVTECKNGNEKAHVEDHLKKPPKPTTIKRNDMQAASTKDSTHKELVRPSKSGSKVPLSSNTTSVKVKPTSAKSSKTPETLNVTNICKPVTRQAAMLLQAARQNEEKKNTNVNTLSLSTKAVKSEKKVKVKEDSTTPALSSMSLLPQPPPIPPPPSSANVMDKHLPLLASEHSYVKRLPDSPTEVAPKSSKLLRGLTKQRLPSDFSSDDDEPLARKQKVSSSTVIKKSKYLSGNDQQNMEGPKHPSKSKGPGKFLRSSKDVVTSKMVDVPKTSTGRLSRKTKEAATVYLELLGQKLYSGEDDYDVPVKKKKTLPKGASKKIHLMADSNKFKTVPDLRSNHRNTPSSANKGKGKLNVSESMLDISSSSTLSSTTTTSSSSSPFDNDKERPGDKPSDKCKLNKPSSGYNTRTPNAHLNRTDVIKTRDYMKKLSEAQFNLDKAQGKKSVFNKDGHQKVGTQKVSKTSSVSKNAKPLMGVSANEGTQQCQETQMSALKVKSTLKDSRVKNHPENQQDAKRNFVQDLENSSKRTKSKLGPKARVQNVNIQSTDKDTMKVPERSKNAPLKKSNVFRSPFKPPVKTTRLNVMMGPTESTRESRHGKVKKRSFKHRRSSSSSSSSSFRVPIPIKRGPGRVPAIHALRCYPSSPSSSSSSSSDSSSTSSSESSDDYPSKPESTTISVRQNVTSASVAVQVNLLNDISDLDDDFWEPGFLDTDLEGLFAMDRVVTPTLCKSSSPSMSQSRSGLELDATPPSFKAVKSGDPTPTKKMTPTPEKVDLPSSSISDRLKAKHPIKDVKPVPSSLPSCSPLQLK